MAKRLKGLALAGLLTGVALGAAQAADKPHNVVLFVPDGLRALIVDAKTAPAMAALRDGGVWFKNSHSIFPTFTTANASAMATGHYLGDTGDFSNVIYSGFPVAAGNGTVTPFIENDAILGELDQHLGGNYLDEHTLLEAARMGGHFSTAAIGKHGPTLIFDHLDRTGEPTIVFDDATGSPIGIPLAKPVADALTAANLPLTAPGRGDNGKAGNATTPGTTAANVDQQKYFVDVATKVVLPMFKARNQPFLLVFWSRDPDGSQHNQGDSLNQTSPGINGPTSMAGIKNADDNLKAIQDALASLGLADTTDVIVSADHGFSTISKESRTSPAAGAHYADVPAGYVPPGFLAIDIGAALKLPVYDPDNKYARLEAGSHPKGGNAVLGDDPNKPTVVVAANGGSDLIYFPTKDKALAGRVVQALLTQDYVSGLFVDEALGRFNGTLPLGAINMKGAAVTPQPAIAVNFRSTPGGCAEPTNCAIEVSDTILQQGQGMHGSFSRADTMNFQAAAGPDFKKGFVDPAPSSNADVGKTIVKILGLKVVDKGKLVGRPLAEAMSGGSVPKFTARTLRSRPADGLVTVLDYQEVGRTRYFDAAGFPGRTVGLSDTTPGAHASAK
jgi:hypothetical protein